MNIFSNRSAGQTGVIFEDNDYEDYGDKDGDDQDYGDWVGDNYVCPKSPLDYEYYGEYDYGNGWTGVCENLNSTDSRNNSQSHNNTATILQNVSGAGASKGLSVIVDSLACGWLSSNVFEGIKVVLIFQFQKLTKCKI